MFDGEYSDEPSRSRAAAEEAGCLAKTKSKNKRRFNDEQIRSLETMFESESKLEPQKKLQLAGELGLQPRQVAIWFQNKRARWKSKQLERDYSLLWANYNTLASQFEALKKQQQSLVIQLQKLHDLTEKSGEEGQRCREALARNSTDGKSDHGDNTNSEFEVNPSLSLDGPEHGIVVLSDGDSSINFFGLDGEPNLLNMVESAEPQNWGSLDGLLDQHTSGYQWWDFRSE